MIELGQRAATRVVVTGGAGFLGKHVTNRLLQLGYHRVFCPRSADYDLTIQSNVGRLYQDLVPDLVIHLAAQVGGIGANERHPGKFLYNNLIMGVHVLEEARIFGIPKILVAGTVCAYPKFTPVPFRESDLWSGYPEETNAPYGLAKKMLLAMSQAYRQEYGFNSAVVFPANLYGPFDNFHPETSHVIPAIICKVGLAVKKGESEVVLWGDGTPTREFLYVEDAAEAIVLAAERYDSSKPMNLGTGVEISILDLAALIGRLMRYQGGFIFNSSRPNGQPRRVLDVSRASREIGWIAQTSLEAGLKKTIDYWYKVKG